MHLSLLHQLGGKPGLKAVPQGQGTLIGNMTNYNGLAAAFDGAWNVGHYPTSAGVNASSGVVGKDWGAPKVVLGFKAGSTSDRGWAYAGSGNVVLSLLGGNVNDAASAVNLGSSVPKANIVSDTIEMYDCNPSQTPYRYHWLKVEMTGGATVVYICECEFYEIRWI
jgi:hypothetical protein